MDGHRKYALLPKGKGWREELAARQTAWATRNLDDIHEAISLDVYNRGRNAERMEHIARSYGVRRDEFEPVYGEAWRLGHNEMQSMIASETLRYCMESNMPVAKIWMGKALGGLTEGPTASAEAGTTEDGTLQINVNVIRKKPLEEGTD